MMPRNSTLTLAICLFVAGGNVPSAEAWSPTSPMFRRQGSWRKQSVEQQHPSPHISRLSGSSTGNENDQEPERKKGFFEMFSPYNSKIPPDLREEIYAAEANTPAAKERGLRVTLYILISFFGVMSAFFNGFLTELRGNGVDASGGIDLSEAGFGWVVSNPLFSFLFLNKIGGGFCLIGGGGAGLLAEAELDTKRINAEKIYEELERRRQARMQQSKPGNSSRSSASSKKKRRGGKEAKRLEALSEVIATEESLGSDHTTGESQADVDNDGGKSEKMDFIPEKDKGGIFGSIKSFYDKADSMAASQALLMNKRLEDAGIVEKITDESGLKVIGREQAARLKDEMEKTEM